MESLLTEREKAEAKELLKAVLSIPTVNSCDDEWKLASFLADYFQEAGVPAQLQRIDGRRGNVIARIKGKQPGRTVVFNGHLDTVPYGDTEKWDTDPSRPVEKDGSIFARGVSDMKSGLAAMAYALAAISRRGEKPNCSYLFLGTCDEEKNGLGAQKILQEDLLGYPEVMLIGEPTENNLGVAQKGCLWIKLTVKGKTSHGAYPWEGINSVQNTFYICEKIKQYAESFTDPILGRSTAAVTKVCGGIAPNMVPDFCETVMDIRTVTSKQHESILNGVEQILEDCQKRVPGLEISVEQMNNRRTVAVKEEEDALRVLSACAQQISGRKPDPIGINFFTDASILTLPLPELPVLLFGPGRSDMAHKPNEFVELSKYYDAICCFKMFCKRY